MNARSLAVLVPAFVVLVALNTSTAAAGSVGGGTGFTPSVPISAFGLARDWIDPSRLHVTSTVSVGSSSWGSRGMSALQVTTLSYSFKAPVSMSVSLGNAWAGGDTRGRQSLFLEGFHLEYRPTSSMQFQIHYQDLRSPLQFQSYGFGGPGRWGY